MEKVCKIEMKDNENKFIPRTCPLCGLGNCVKGLDRKSLLKKIDELEKQNNEMKQILDNLIERNI